MTADQIGMVSGLLVIISVIPYGIRTYQRKIQPKLTSWFLWTIIGLALLLTYRSAGAEANVWPAVFAFTNPLLITTLLLLRREELTKMSHLDKACLVFGTLALVLWALVREQKELAQYTLCLAIVADSFAAIPTIVFLWKHPDQDRPFAWALFAVAYGLAMFAITDHTFANYILPIYMLAGSLLITAPLTLYRIKQRLPWHEWV